MERNALENESLLCKHPLKKYPSRRLLNALWNWISLYTKCNYEFCIQKLLWKWVPNNNKKRCTQPLRIHITQPEKLKINCEKIGLDPEKCVL